MCHEVCINHSTLTWKRRAVLIPIMALALRQIWNHAYANHKSLSFKLMNVFVLITGLLLGIYGKCASYFLGGRKPTVGCLKQT